MDLLTLFTIWPFPEKQVEALGERVDRIIVPEMNLGQLAYEVERMVGRKKVRRVRPGQWRDGHAADDPGSDGGLDA